VAIVHHLVALKDTQEIAAALQRSSISAVTRREIERQGC
jgi:hypothetical protein